MSERSEAEWAKIENPGWLGSLRDRSAEIFDAFRTLEIKTSEIHMIWWEIPTVLYALPGDTEIRLAAGHDDEGRPLYDWIFPAAWFQPYDWWQDRQPPTGGP